MPPAFATGTSPVNLARFCFLDPAAEDLYPDWGNAADTTVNLLRTEAGRDPYSKALTDLVGELATRSDDFRTRWAAHNVRLHHTGVKHFQHPSSAASTSPSRPCHYPPTPASPSPPTAPKPAPRPTTPCACWRAGLPPRRRTLRPISSACTRPYPALPQKGGRHDHWTA
jgi:hypothetical protein